MPLLRLTQHIENEDNYRIEIAFEDDDGSRQTADVKFQYQFTTEDRVDMRWYLEDYLQYPLDPAPKIAARVEKRMAELGEVLFKKVFKEDEAASDLWATLRSDLDNTRVEVLTDVQGANALPWELLRDPKTEAVMALRAKSFVRAYTKAAQKPDKAQKADKVRILLVICRPGGREDVPFRSVASHLLKGLGDEASEAFDLDVLRPPTFEQLSRVLHNAKSNGKPYHIVHFDGHGGYLDFKADKPSDYLRSLIPLMLGGPREGSHGYLFFENPQSGQDENVQLVDGPSLGKLLADTDTPVLVLNACRSAHADIQEEPEAVEDVHSQVRAFGSLAQEVMDAGVAGVVAMRYNVYVVTAAQFVADLYAALASGQTLGQAVSMGRKQLAAQPLREIAFEPRPLQDWSVPVVYEAAPISLFPKLSDAGTAPLRIDISQTSKPTDDLPRPDVGFYGRDETLLALDRAFDKHQVVLLHAYAGSGKTMTAAEFARWYSQTGGLSPRDRGEAGGGPILFTSFEQYKPLERVLDTIGQVFGPTLENSGIQWLALSDEDRLNVTVQVLKQIPVLWIWDNVEPINGFPSGTKSAWSEKEQRDLKNFLSNMSALTKAKFLLTSRRDEGKWLGDLPARVGLPPMPMQERVQLARALADKLGKKMSAVEDWKPLLKFTRGNPLTLTVLVGQALRDGIKTKAQVYEFVNQLRTGEAAFEDESSEGRSKSLGVSLSYGFAKTFKKNEQLLLALTCIFSNTVNTAILYMMGHHIDEPIDEISNFEMNYIKDVLDRATEIGMLTAMNASYYSIHPGLRWFFNNKLQESVDIERYDLAFTQAFSQYCILLYNNDLSINPTEIISRISYEKENILKALEIAKKHLFLNGLTNCILCLSLLYDNFGNYNGIIQLIEENYLLYSDKKRIAPISKDVEEEWALLTEKISYYEILIGNYQKAEKYLSALIDYRENKTSQIKLEETNKQGNENFRALGIAYQQLGHLLRSQKKQNCLIAYNKAIEIFEQLSEMHDVAITAYNIGNAYKYILEDINEAERWVKQALNYYNKTDFVSRAQALDFLGLIQMDRYWNILFIKSDESDFDEIYSNISSNPVNDEVISSEVLSNNMKTRLKQAESYCVEARNYFELALETIDGSDNHIRANFLSHLGNTYESYDIEKFYSYQTQALKTFEILGDSLQAGTTRFIIADVIYRRRKFRTGFQMEDALLYARAALRDFESYGGRAREDEEKTKRLIAQIEADLAKSNQ
jgi:tetratricopeptide (TPR) repeat protein